MFSIYGRPELFFLFYHWSSLVLLNGNGVASFLNSRGGVT